MRLNWQNIQKYRDGLTLDASGSPALLRAIAKILPPTSLEQNDRFWFDCICSSLLNDTFIRDLYFAIYQAIAEDNFRSGLYKEYNSE
ncbi:MAG: hypothetical protein ACFCU7_19465 [Pleurocapsa sp.]